MGKQLVWCAVGDRKWYAGISKTALYPFDKTTKSYPLGVAWNGITGISENPSGAESTPQYANNIKYADIIGKEEMAGKIEAFFSPKEFDACDGSVEVIPGVSVKQQTRQPFGLSYVTQLGNDTDSEEYGYIIHLIYNCKASPSERSHKTFTENVELETLSWDFSTTPEAIAGKKPSAVIEINSKNVDAAKLAAFEAIIWGSETADPRLPLPAEVFTLLTKVVG